MRYGNAIEADAHARAAIRRLEAWEAANPCGCALCRAEAVEQLEERPALVALASRGLACRPECSCATCQADDAALADSYARDDLRWDCPRAVTGAGAMWP